jgi:SAM-dependent methyltransferase
MTTSAKGPFDQFIAETDAFEDLVLRQQPFTPEHYDDDYFASEWREDGNKYELETRREIEARNPELIKEAFNPTRVLDVGCGPGFLMQFLHELGIDVRGVDFSRPGIELAPRVVKDLIRIGPTDPLDEPDGSFDLVICREVVEHLTVLQARRTVAELCRVSSRFVYVTTRFHPNPRNLLDVATDFQTDPTHITLMSKDLLRTLFVLEGYRRRAHLEDVLDWGNKGRVLVYERVVP